MSRGERVARLKTLARAIGNAAAPSIHVGSFGMTAAAVHPRAVTVGIPSSTDRLVVKLILGYRLGMSAKPPEETRSCPRSSPQGP
jgi:hypothetical protein